MNIRPPLQEESGSVGWSNFFTQLFESIGWVKSWSYKFTLDFPSVPGNSQSPGQQVTIPGVRQGDSVHVTPYSDASGISYKAVVAADDTIIIYACNFTTGSINPDSMLFRIVVIQN